jgi:PTS system mannose-specific IID component
MSEQSLDNQESPSNDMTVEAPKADSVSKYKITKHDLRQSAFRYMFMACNVFNYETRQGPGIVWGLSPTLRKIYPNDDDYQAAQENHYKFFNTTTWMGNMILGASLAMEEKDGRKAGPAIQSFKTGLMGPLAGVGDTLIWVLLPTIMGSISGYMALQGNPFGGVVWFLLNVLFLFVRFNLFSLGYKSGVKLITSMGDRLSTFTEAASVLGLTVVGALIATVVKINVPVVFTMGQVKLALQKDVFNAIMPSLLPVALCCLVYWLLGKKWMTITRVIVLVLVLAIFGAWAGVFSLA